MILMQELVKSTEKVEKILSMKLQSRLLYLLLKCPLMQDRGCECNRVERGKASRPRRLYTDDENVVLRVTIPYALRRAARAAHLDCNELTRKALVKQLKKADRK